MDRRRLLGDRAEHWLHTVLLLGGLGLLAGLLAWIIAGPSGVVWTLFLGVITFGGGPRLSRPIIERLFGARALHRWEAAELYDVAGELARRAGLETIPQLYFHPSGKPNAFTIGRGAEASIVLSAGLLSSLSPRELTGVIAHELGHVRNDDVWTNTVAGVVARLIRSLSTLSLFLFVFGFLGSAGPFTLLFLFAAPTLGGLLRLALSRTREFDADLEAVALTGDPRGLASALDKLEAHGMSLIDVQQALLKQNVLIPAGSIKIGLQELQVFTNANVERVEQLNDVPIKMVGDVPVLMRDVGRVENASQGAVVDRGDAQPVRFDVVGQSIDMSVRMA